MGEGTGFERLLRRERAITAAGLAVLCVLAAAYVLTGAGLGMDVGAMTRLTAFPHKAAAAGMGGMGMGGMGIGGLDMAGLGTAAAGAWTPRIWLLTIGMWAAMMVVMMTPSAAPTILLYGRVRAMAQVTDQAGNVASIGVFAAGYLLVWLGFSVAAAALQWALERSALLSPATLGSQSRWLSAAVLLAAGVWQLSPIKTLCLTRCRFPVEFLARHWRPGTAGAVRLGIMHGAYCVGCCWVLMALLFVGGVMNLAWIAALAVLVMAEKLAPRGPWVARAAGGVLVAWSLATLVQT